ncbi:uncharacterized protein KY384_005665 [Bacidia gigantensis]|uniref:uncharacterized protein n=1 Tax=Bacidia gigantensis TaxID=2732470 RepID=UPI001D04BDFF|nr:uncharacterized protein KY384_005665 [Bacidia gigantensis]KAG8530182.1 hypothetical protein KY384_005665 [Bacidia gigantensis]
MALCLFRQLLVFYFSVSAAFASNSSLLRRQGVDTSPTISPLSIYVGHDESVSSPIQNVSPFDQISLGDATFIVFYLPADTDNNNLNDNAINDLALALINILVREDKIISFAQIPGLDKSPAFDHQYISLGHGEPSVPVSSSARCKLLYNRFIMLLEFDSTTGYYNDFGEGLISDYSLFFSSSPNETLACVAFIRSGEGWSYGEADVSRHSELLCDGSPLWDLTVKSWSTPTDDSIRAFIQGGDDSDTHEATPDGVWWSGLSEGESFTKALGIQLLGVGNFDCNLENPCKQNLVCTDVGSRTALLLQKTVLPSLWGYIVIASVLNINQQLNNVWVALGAAAASTALDNFNIDDFYPTPDTDPGIGSILAGLGPILGLFSGIEPFGPAIGAGGNVLSAFSSYLSESISQSKDPDLAQKLFAPRAKAIYRQFGTALDKASLFIFNGSIVPSEPAFNITDMMSNGTWVDSMTALTPVSDLELNINIEITSRSINELWNTFPNNKRWVLYVNLNDINTNASCVADMTGPPDSKYCADEGVYYTYNFIPKDGQHQGVVGYPWGGQKLSEVGLNLTWVTEASARSYRLAKQTGTDPFNFSYPLSNATLLTQALYPEGCQDFDICAGRYAGSWTLPVCDASDWGKPWNFNYNNSDFGKPRGDSLSDQTWDGGPGGSETAAWAKAAGMADPNFDTYYDKCSIALTSDFQWPSEISSVDLGFGDLIQKPKKRKVRGWIVSLAKKVRRAFSHASSFAQGHG